MITALALFAATYLVLAIGRFPGLRVDRTGATIIGAAGMVAGLFYGWPVSQMAIV